MEKHTCNECGNDYTNDECDLEFTCPLCGHDNSEDYDNGDDVEGT